MVLSTTIGYAQIAKRIEKSASFIVKARIENTFPLFGPIREKEWAVGWEPEVVYATHSEVEQYMIFKTPGKLPDEKYTWIVTQYRPEEYLIEYTVSAQDRIWFITVRCKSQREYTAVTVTYTYTGFTEAAHQLNKQAIEKMFAHELKDWEEAVNYFLQSGKCLE
jgi:hypothetical protein